MKNIRRLFDKLYEAPMWVLILGWVVSFVWLCLAIASILKT